MPDLEAKLSRESGEIRDSFWHFSICVVLPECERMRKAVREGKRLSLAMAVNTVGVCP
jgi:hypothetical protein